MARERGTNETGPCEMTQSAWRIEGAELELSAGRRLRFSEAIDKVVEVGPTLVVLLGGTTPRNALGVREGKVVWQLAPTTGASGYYVNVEVRNGKLLVWDFDCLKIEVDPSDGSVLDAQFTK